MNIEEETISQERLEKVSKALEEARKLQQEWLAYGIDCVNLYVEDVDGDWLEKWGEDEEEAEAIVSGHTIAVGLAVESVTSFLESDDTVAVKVRKRLGGRSLLEIATELKKCLNLPEEEQSYAVMDILAGSFNDKENNRDSSRGHDGIELVELADDLLERLTEICK